MRMEGSTQGVSLLLGPCCRSALALREAMMAWLGRHLAVRLNVTDMHGDFSSAFDT